MRDDERNNNAVVLLFGRVAVAEKCTTELRKFHLSLARHVIKMPNYDVDANGALSSGFLDCLRL